MTFDLEYALLIKQFNCQLFNLENEEYMKLQNTDMAIAITNAGTLTDILRILSMLEKASDRLVRLNCNRRSQYPAIVRE